MNSSSSPHSLIVGGYFPISETAAELSLEFADADPLSVMVDVKPKSGPRIAGANRTVSWAELRLARGALAVLRRYERDHALERLAGCEVESDHNDKIR